MEPPRSLVDLDPRPLAEGRASPTLLSSPVPDLPFDRLAAVLPELIGELQRSGAVVLRGFALDGLQRLETLIQDWFGPLLRYTERSSPRHSVEGRIYTSTDYPSNREIFLHNEQSYNLVFPRLVAFYCQTPARYGGATLVADCRAILGRLPASVVTRFRHDGYRLIRNYRPHIGLSWQEAFQTTDRLVVDDYCDRNDIERTWLSADELRTEQRRDVIAQHPTTGEEAWVNHATFFHPTTLGAETSSLLIGEYGEMGMPTTTLHGNGEPIEPEVLDDLRQSYRRETVGVVWEQGDLLLLDNILSCHGRAPFQPPRDVVTCFAQPVAWSDVRA